MNIELNEGVVLFTPLFHQIQRGDLSVIIDPELPNWIATDRRGAKVLSYIDGRRNFREVVEEYCKTQGVDLAKGWLHCHTLIKDALRCEMVSTTPFVRAIYPGRAEVLRLDRLRELWLHITNACNLACTHCLVESSPSGIRGVSTEHWKRIIDEALDLGVERFYITGGEPFVREDIFDLIRHITSKAELIMLTNAMLLKGKRLERLKTFDPERLKLQISLDGSKPEINDPVRGHGTFASTVEGIKNVVGAGFVPTITTAVMSCNADDVPEVTKLVAELGGHNHHLLWTYRRGRALSGSGLSSPPVNRLIEILQRTLKTAEERGVQVDNFESIKLRVSGRRGVKVDLSNAAYNSLCVYADGHVFPSAAFAGFEPMDMGSALEKSLSEVWRHASVAEPMRRATVQRKAKCKDSYLKFFCGGGDIEHTYFYSSNGNGSGSFLAEDPYADLHHWMITEAMFSIAGERSARKNRSGFDSPTVYYAMGEGALSHDGTNGNHNSEGFEVATLHSTCVLSFDLEASREVVRRFYAQAAEQPQAELCCPGSYVQDDTSHIPKEVLEIAYGCGSPVSFAELKQGEVFLDLGSGGGIDCFIAAKKVGAEGQVIGIDMTDEMLAIANENKIKVAAYLGYHNVEFKKGYLEELPLPNKSVDVVTSNCVINLSPDKKRVFLEIWRVLKDHGRIIISDTVAYERIPEYMRANPRLWGECVSGALTEDEYLAYLERAGFYGLSVLKKSFWKEVEGHKFYSVILRGYKFEKTSGCVFIGQKAVYRGPFKAAVDEEGHLFPRNEVVEICTDTAAKLRNAPYDMLFTVIDPDKPEDNYACCAPGGSCC